jgi:exodeoxyribonuclease V beta subunit
VSARAWRDDLDLPPATTWLLEASAGTGKTFQIAGLFTRLVAEYGVPAERILAVTFTNAATAELRDRVRGRLRDALALVRAEHPETDDPIFRRLLALPSADEGVARETLEQRLELALRGFDLAPISTIHGFSQRMLQELAFDSGQDPEPEILADAGEVLEQIVDDTLADLFARATPAEVTALQAAGLDRATLLDVARKMCGATEPRVVPARAGSLEDEIARASARAQRIAALRVRWAGAEGQAAREALIADVRGKRLGSHPNHYQSSLDKVGVWLAHPDPIDFDEAWCARLRIDALGAAWKVAKERPQSRPWWAPLAELDAIWTDEPTFFRDLAPRAAFARDVRARVEAELQRRRVLTYDGMLSRLAERVARDGGAQSPLAARIRDKFDAVLVDEFQDTDDAQWRVIEAAFHGHRRLFLIGDPKQAIYAFRGADVHVYLQAARVVEPAHRRTMAFNWRSDPAAVHAMNALFREGSGAFDQDAIDYVHVSPKKPDRLAPAGAGLELRWVDDRVLGGEAGAPIGRKIDGTLAALAAREAVAWLHGERGALLDKGQPQRIEPGDLAVLVNGHHEGRAVRNALARVGVPAVAASRGSVFDTPPARWLAAWLDGVAGAGRDREARHAAVTPLFGWTADELSWALAIASGGEPVRAQAIAAGGVVRDWNAWTERLRAAAERWPRHGFARTFDAEAVACDVYPRVLAQPDGERHATDLRHLFELLHVEDRTRRGSPRALAEWLRAQAEVDAEEHAQRLESDARAVTIETVHASKGLEYPIVLLPFVGSARGDRDGGGPLLVRGDPPAAGHGASAELNLSPPGSDARAEAFARAQAEQRREGLRKLYVALTRAKHRTVAWYGPIGEAGDKTSATSLGRLLMRDPRRAGFDDAAMPVFAEGSSAWPSVEARLDALAHASEGAIAWRAEEALASEPEAPRVDERAGAGGAAGEEVTLATARWPSERPSLLGPWTVTSYSGLAAASVPPDEDEKLFADAAPAIGGAERRPTRAAPAVRIDPPPLASIAAPPRLSLGAGTVFGTWVHAIFEQLDFASGLAKDGRPLDALVRAEGAKLGLGGEPALAKELIARLPALLSTPLDAKLAGGVEDPLRGLPRGFALKDLTRADRLDELAFDLRLGDGTAYRARPEEHDAPLAMRPGCVDPGQVLDAIAGAVGQARGPSVSAWLAWLGARRAAGEALIGSIAGVLTGSIDLVFRTRGGDTASDDGRYYVIDYKTNRIGAASAGHYAAAWLDWEMATTGYLLQALLYTLALHRHLRARLRRYDYDAHVGGYLYLFLRGMAGPETPRDPATGRCLGVFGDRWPRAVIESLDQALAPSFVSKPAAAGDEVSR